VLSLNSGLKGKHWRYLAVIALVTLSVLLLILTRPDRTPELVEAAVSNVLVTRVATHRLLPQETVSGRLEPKRKTALHFELNGQLSERQVEPGQRVEAGAVLLAVDADDYRDALASAEAQLELEIANIRRDRELLALARRNHALQKSEVARLETLGKDSLISQSRLDEARIKQLQLESEVAQLSASTATAKPRLGLQEAARNRAARDLGRTRLQAPFTGAVNAVQVQVGDYVTPSQPVVELIDATELDLYVEVRGELARALVLGQQLSVSVGDLPLGGRIIGLQLDPDPETFTHALRVRVPGEGVRPGMLARVQLPLHPLEDVIAVPLTAVLLDEGRAYVFRLVDGTLSRVEVKTGRRVDDLQVIRSGLAVGDQVVVSGVAAYTDGQPARILGEH
jgi:RND family efflux transporter MFP subunit